MLAESKVTPWHQHPEADEVIYLLEGAIEIVILRSLRRRVIPWPRAEAARGSAPTAANVVVDMIARID